MIPPIKVLRWLPVLLLLGGAWLILQPQPVEAIPVTVTVTTELDNLATATGDGECSLREAIIAVNSDTGAGFNEDACTVPAGATSYIIDFAGNFTIFVDPAMNTPLPPITADQVTIRGLVGGTKTALRGGGVGGASNGLVLSGDGAIITGLDIRSFTQFGLVINDSANHTIGSTVALEENSMALNIIGGIAITGVNATDNVVIGNTIGFNNIDSNGSLGVLITGGANNNRIGGPTADELNLLSGNPDAGVRISGATTTANTIIGNEIASPPGAIGVEMVAGSQGNTVTDNLIGAGAVGVLLAGVTGNTIGPNNTISGQQLGGAFGTGHGVYVLGASNSNSINGNTIGPVQGNGISILEAGTSNNTVTGNQMGTLLVRGVHIFQNATGNTVGPNNTITAATTAGVLVDAAPGNVVSGNMIQNNLGNGVTPGVAIINSNNVQINNNTIAGNQGNGVEATGSSTLTINSNIIQTNGSDGIDLISASDVIVRNNTISQNTDNGIRVEAGNDNLFGTNSIADNGRLGIDLVVAGDPANGVTLNDIGDGDIGPNGLINFPVFTATSDGDSVNVVGDVQAAGAHIIDLFVNGAADPSGFGEGETPLGFRPSAADGSFIFTLNGTGNLAGQFVTATASQTGVGTSEFSQAVPVNTLIAAFTANPVSGVAPLTVNFTDTSTSTLPIVTYQWNFGDASIPDPGVPNPTVVYNTPGIYTVWLVIFDSNGNADAFSLQIEVLPGLATNTPVPSNTPVPVDTSTPLPPATNTPIPTNTPLPTATNTDIPTNTPLPTATNTDIPTNTPLPTATNTDIPTNTPLPTATNTDIPTNTPLPTATNTDIPTSTNTLVPTITPFPTATPLPVASNTPVPGDLEVDKGPGEGDEVIIEITNNGPGDAFNVTLEEDLRQGVVYISSSPGAPVCVEQGGLVTCELGTIDAGDSSVVAIEVETDGVDPLSGQTTVSADNVQPVTIDEPYLIKLGRPPFAQPGAEIVYTLRVINPTNQAVSNVRVTDQMPAGITIESVQASSGTVGVIGQSVSFSQGSLAAGGRVTITIVTTLAEDAEDLEITNEACLTSSANVEPSCAQFGFFRARQLPSTGEPPLLPWLLFGSGFVSLGSLILLTGLYLRRRQTV